MRGVVRNKLDSLDLPSIKFKTAPIGFVPLTTPSIAHIDQMQQKYKLLGTQNL
jgi:hypothetical protein